MIVKKLVGACFSLFLIQPAFAQTPNVQDALPKASEFASLKLMRKKELISEAEYESALRDLGQTNGALAGSSMTFVLSKWSTSLYGFVEADHIFDTTQSFNDAAGNAQVARADSYQGAHSRMIFGLRNSRVGFRIAAPEFHHIRASGNIEIDFLGTLPPTTENIFFTSFSPRVRHLHLKLEHPILDLLIGQYWHLFAWQPFYHRNSVQIQGLPGQIYSRTPQVRISKTLKTSAFSFDFALAMMRPPQKDSSTPEGQAGVRFSFNDWSAMQTIGATGTSIMPVSIAVSADVRRFSLSEFSATPKASADATGWGVAANAFVPILNATSTKKGNSLALIGEYAYGSGIADLFTGLTGGVTFPPLPNPGNLSPAPAYTPNVDPGMVVYAADGTAQLVNWQTYHAGLQYYFPKLDGRLWISANYTRLESNNAALFGDPTKIRKAEDWVDANIFGDATPSLRLGLEYAYSLDHYADGVDAFNHRIQLSAFYIF